MVQRFASVNINDCRKFLRDLGLDYADTPHDKGWSKPGWLDIIMFYKGEWHAVAWKS